MKIAVISDIHGNMEALKAVLADIETQKADTIAICGDLALAGPEPVETIDFIVELAKEKELTIIQGNTDEMLVKATGKPDDPYTPPNEIMAEALKYDLSILRDDQKAFLESLPAQKLMQFGEVSVLLTHGSPRKNNENIFPEMKVEEVKEMIKNTNADIIFCGHTHIPAGYQVEKQTVVNVGSVGRPFTEEPEACYAILEIPDLNKKEFSITHRFIDYDKETASKKLERQPFKGSDKLAAMLIKAETRYPGQQ